MRKTILLLAVILVGLTLLRIRPYQFNVTSLFHMDEYAATGNAMPANFVILNAPSYDGAQYYQIARNIPKILNPHRWIEVRSNPPGSYAYQRVLLPFVAFILALGITALLPWSFLIINLGSLLLTAWLLLRRYPRKSLHVLALCLSPAAMVAMHFTLAEPITILLITLALLRYREAGKITLVSLLCLMLVVLAREVNILFIGFMMGWSLLTKRWKDAALLILPALVFVGWHSVIYGMFGNVPFLLSAEAGRIPGSALLDVLLGHKGYNRLTITSIALFLGFVLPTTIYVLTDIIRRKKVDVLSLGTLAFLCVMYAMPDYIWGSITSIGRVITPVYPLAILLTLDRSDTAGRALAILMILLGVGASIALALSTFSYTLTAA